MVAAAMFCPAAVYAAEPAAQEETENSDETAPADFQMNPYDGNDMNNYTLSREYTGSDPYQWAKIWYNVDRDLIKADSDMEMSLMVNAFTGVDDITLEMAIL